MRYLVVIPGFGAEAARFHDLVSEDALAAGDQLRVADRLLRIRAAVDIPTDDGYDGTLVCTADTG